MLERYPTENIKVYAVWFSMVKGDSRDAWPSRVLTDSRVTHLWDETKVVGTWYPAHQGSGSPGDVLWDSFLLYPKGVRWDEAATKPVTWGAPIVQDHERLEMELPKVLKDASAPPESQSQ